MIEIIIRKVKPPKMNNTQEGAAGVDRTKETTSSKVKADDMTNLPITLNTISWASITSPSPSPWDFHIATFG